MESKIVNELLEIYKISDKEEKERRLNEIYENNSNVKPSSFEMPIIKMKNIEQQKKDYYQRLVLEDDAFSDDWFKRLKLDKQSYILWENEFNVNLEICFNNLFFYNPKLLFLLSLQKKIPVLIYNENKPKSKWATTTIIGCTFMETYKNSFLYGIDCFEKAYEKHLNELHLESNREYLIKELCLSCYGIESDLPLEKTGWYSIAFGRIKGLDNISIENIGENSGRIYMFNKLPRALIDSVQEMKLNKMSNQNMDGGNQTKTIRIFKGKKISAKYYALYHWIKIKLGKELPFEKDEYKRWKKKEIEHFVKNHPEYQGVSSQGFYVEFKGIGRTNKTSIARSYKNYKEIVMHISKNNADIIHELKDYPN